VPHLIAATGFSWPSVPSTAGTFGATRVSVASSTPSGAANSYGFAWASVPSTAASIPRKSSRRMRRRRRRGIGRSRSSRSRPKPTASPCGTGGNQRASDRRLGLGGWIGGWTHGAGITLRVASSGHTCAHQRIPSRPGTGWTSRAGNTIAAKQAGVYARVLARAAFGSTRRAESGQTGSSWLSGRASRLALKTPPENRV